jgi:hypothetical protein
VRVTRFSAPCFANCCVAEEKKFFQVSGTLLSAAQKVKLAGQCRRDYLRMHRLLAAESR